MNHGTLSRILIISGILQTMHRILVILLWLVSSLPLWSVDWEGHASTVGMVYVPHGAETLFAETARMAEEEKARLLPLLGVQHPRWFPIYVYTDHAAFMRDTGRNLMLAGESYQPSGMIRINAGGGQGSLRQVLAHEMVHSLLNDRLGPNIGALPVWVNEGVATLYADDVNADNLLSIAQLIPTSDGILSMPQLETAFSTGKSVDAAYQQSRSMTAWLEYRHPGALKLIFDQMSVGRGFESALDHAAGITPDDWLQRWRQGIPRSLVWLNYTLTILSSPVLFAPLGIILAIAFIVKLLRKRREEEEDDDEELLDFHYAGAPSVSESANYQQYPIWDDLETDAKINTDASSLLKSRKGTLAGDAIAEEEYE